MFSKTATEEYALVVADDSNFANTDIIDVIPLRSKDGGVNLQTWYDFESTKCFTFGKVENLAVRQALTIGTDNFALGEYALNLNVSDFTISAWVRADVTELLWQKERNYKCV